MHKKSSNKSFGILFFIIFLGLGLWPLTKDLSANIYLIFISLLFLILGIINSKILTPINKAWIKLGEILGRLIAPAVMALIYFFIFAVLWVALLGFGAPLLIISGILFGQWIGTLISVISISVGALVLYSIGNFFFRDLVKKIFQQKFDKYIFYYS